MTRLPSITVLFLLFSAAVHAEDRWYEHSLHLYMAQLNNVATIYGRGSYRKLELGNESETGIGYTVPLEDDFDLDFTLSHAASSGTQRGRAGSGDEGDRLNVDLDLKSLHITGKWRYTRSHGLNDLFVPWLGCGLNGKLIDVTETETVLTSGGDITRPARSEMSSAIGIHAVAGLDFYPRKMSALALTLAGRYDLNLLERGPFDGKIGGLAFIFGLRWDFFPVTL